MGAHLSLAETDGIVSVWRRGSPSDDEWQTVLAWLKNRPKSQTAKLASSSMGGTTGNQVGCFIANSDSSSAQIFLFPICTDRAESQTISALVFHPHASGQCALAIVAGRK